MIEGSYQSRRFEERFACGRLDTISAAGRIRSRRTAARSRPPICASRPCASRRCRRGGRASSRSAGFAAVADVPDAPRDALSISRSVRRSMRCCPVDADQSWRGWSCRHRAPRVVAPNGGDRVVLGHEGLQVRAWPGRGTRHRPVPEVVGALAALAPLSVVGALHQANRNPSPRRRSAAAPRPVAFARGRSCSACAAARGGRGRGDPLRRVSAARRGCASAAWCTRQRNAPVDRRAAQQLVELAHEPAFVRIRRRRLLRYGRRLQPQPAKKSRIPATTIDNPWLTTPCGYPAGFVPTRAESNRSQIDRPDGTPVSPAGGRDRHEVVTQMRSSVPLRASVSRHAQLRERAHPHHGRRQPNRPPRTHSGCGASAFTGVPPASRRSTIVDGIPVTSISRTLVDLADILPRAELREVFTTAKAKGLLDMRPSRRPRARRMALLAADAARSDG